MKHTLSKSKKAAIIIIALLIFLSFAFWVFYTNNNISVSHFKIESEKIPSEFKGFKIAQISDLHNRSWDNKLISKLLKEKPDIIVVTGDLIDANHTDIEVAKDFLKKSSKIAMTYYVTGNHEAWLGSFDTLEAEFSSCGAVILNDESINLKRGNKEINLIGLCDPDFAERDSFEGLQESIIETKLVPLIKENKYNIVLCHRPELLSAYAEARADLVFTGHAHGGQIRLPFIGGLIAPNQGLFPEFTSGIYKKDSTQMIVSRGLGNSVLPIRINNMPELVIAQLN